MKIENKLKEIRKKEGLTQIEIARKANITPMSYQRYEAGKRVPNTYTSQLIAKILNSTVEDLFPLPQRQLRQPERK